VVSNYFEQANYVSENTRWTRSQLKDRAHAGTHSPAVDFAIKFAGCERRFCPW